MLATKQRVLERLPGGRLWKGWNHVPGDQEQLWGREAGRVAWTEVKPVNQTERAVGRGKGVAVYPGAMGSRGRALSWGVT